MLLSIVSDDELFVSEIAKSVILVLLTIGIGYNLYQLMIKRNKGSKQWLNSLFLILLAIAFVKVFREFRIEYAMLNNPIYVEGTTTGFCDTFLKGEGVQFEYFYDGRTFSNCNAYHPLTRERITVPGGKYVVRLCDRFESEGRIDLRRKTH